MRLNYKNILFSCLMIISLILTSCGKKNLIHEIDYSDKDCISSFNYTEEADLDDKFDINYYSIGLQDNSYIMNYCIYDSVIYYALFNNIYLDNNEDEIAGGETNDGEIEDGITPSYKIQFRYFNTNTGKDDILCEYKVKNSRELAAIKCNGQYLLFMINNYINDRCEFNTINLKDSTLEKIVMDDDLYMSTNSVNCVTMTKDSLYWFSTDHSDGQYKLNRYNLETKNIEEGITETISNHTCNNCYIFHSDYVMYEKDKSNNQLLYMGDVNSDYKTCMKISSKMDSLLCNNKLCMWVDINNDGDYCKLYIYDYVKKTVEEMNYDLSMLCGIIDSYLFINEDYGLTCYDIRNKHKYMLTSSTYTQMYDLKQGEQNDIYSECSFYPDLSDEKVHTNNTSLTYAPSSYFTLMSIKLK